MSDKLWGGRFAQATAADVEAYTESVSFDKSLYLEDIEGSRAHALMLAEQGIITNEEAETLRKGLNAVRAEIESGEFHWQASREDVHMNIEARLTEIVGSVGGKLHTGRSRNDQVCLDFRLHTAKRLRAWQRLLSDLVLVFVQRAEENVDTLLPGCTHLQPAQPVSLAQHLLAYAWMFSRDFDRAGDALKRTEISPLGAAALAGTTYPLDSRKVADELGLPEVFANSMDAVSDRDFVAEALFIASLTMTHLSRLCEEIILWANPGFGFVRLPDAYATGSSIMPQKKNPDVAELMRGKVGRVYGDLTAVLTLLKGLPLAYNRDMQEDKQPFFDADRTVSSSLTLMAGMMREIGFNGEAMKKALQRGFVNATELADYLVGKGMPFREAHHVTGRAVAHAEEQGLALEDLSLAMLKEFSPLIEEDVFTALAFETAVARRESPGGTGPNAVRKQIEALKEKFSEATA